MSKIEVNHEQETEAFFNALISLNPFSSNRVNDPSQENVDVSTINGEQFLDLVNLAKETLENKNSRGVMLLGGSGVGKSHLISRLAEWCRKGKNPGIFVFLHNLMASPENVAHYFVYYVMCMLTKATESFHDSMLYEIMKKALKLAHKQANLDTQVSPEKSHKAFKKFFAGLKLKPEPINDQVCEVLFNFFRIVNMKKVINGDARDEVTAIIDWLSGNPIGDESASKIGLNLNAASKNEDGQYQIQDNESIKQVLLILTTLAAEAEKPFIICIDQVDNLYADQVQAIARFLHAVLDHASNLFVIISGVYQTMQKFIDDKVIPESTLDRVGESKIVLNRVTVGEAKEIISARINKFLDNFKLIPEVMSYRSKYELFPLSISEYEKYIGDRIEVRPRDVISWARDCWRNEQKKIKNSGFKKWLDSWPVGNGTTENGGTKPTVDINPIIDQTILSRINEAVSVTREQKGSLPPEADNLATLVYELLKYCTHLGESYSIEKVTRINGKNPAYHLEVIEKKNDSPKLVVNGVAFVTNPKGTSSGPALNRLLKVTTKLDHRILVTDDERAPLGNAKTIVEAYTELKKLGQEKFIHIRLDFEQYATLDALYNVLANSKSGDIEIYHPSIGNKVVTVEETLQSMNRLDLFKKHPLLRELLMEPSTIIVDPPKIKIEEPDGRQLILGWLAFNLCVTTNKLIPQLMETHPQYNQLDNNSCHEQLNEIARKMEQEKKIIVKEYSGTLMLTKSVM